MNSSYLHQTAAHVLFSLILMVMLVRSTVAARGAGLDSVQDVSKAGSPVHIFRPCCGGVGTRRRWHRCASCVLPAALHVGLCLQRSVLGELARPSAWSLTDGVPRCLPLHRKLQPMTVPAACVDFHIAPQST